MSSFQDISPTPSPPPGEDQSSYPSQPTRAPPPPPIAPDVKGKGTWRPSSPRIKSFVAPPSPPSDGETQFPRRTSEEILERIMPNTPRQSEDLPRTLPLETEPRKVTPPPVQTDRVSPASTAFAAVESGEISPLSAEIPVPHDDENRLPTFAESQEAYGHANPLLAHPVSRPTGHAPLDKMPADAERSRSRAQSMDYPSAAFPSRKPVPPPRSGGSSTFPGVTARSSSSSIPSNSNGELINDPSVLPPTTATIRGPSSHRIASSKPGFFSQLGQKTSVGLNNLAHKFGGTGFLPDSLDNECEKAALILKTFCKNGVYADTSKTADEQGPPPKGHSRSASNGQKRTKTLVTIPNKVINKAVGLAIFTTCRAGINLKGATGSGILISRRHDGSWGGPSAIQLNSIGGGVMVGLDIFDCVCVINTQESLNAFMDSRVSFGADVAVAAGPWGAGGSVDWGKLMDRENVGSSSDTAGQPLPPTLEINGEPLEGEARRGRARGQDRPSPCYSYVKSRGFYAGSSFDGTIITERKSANSAFYGEMVNAEQVLRGQVTPPRDNASLRALWGVLRGAEGLAPVEPSSNEGITSPTEIAEPAEISAAPSAARPSEVPSSPPPAYPENELHPMAARMF